MAADGSSYEYHNHSMVNWHEKKEGEVVKSNL